MNYFAGLFISLFLPLGAPNRDLDNFIIGVTNRHNFYRRQHQNTPDLTGDRKLNADAQKYADHLCATSGFKHSTDRHGQGENLYASWSTTNNPKSFKNPNIGVDDWYNEGRDFGWKYGSGRGFSHNTGHFTQIVWASTTRLGVGRCVQRNYRRGGRSYSRMVLVARYSPAGNIRNRGNRLYDANVLPIGHSSSRPRPTTRTTHRPAPKPSPRPTTQKPQIPPTPNPVLSNPNPGPPGSTSKCGKAIADWSFGESGFLFEASTRFYSTVAACQAKCLEGYPRSCGGITWAPPHTCHVFRGDKVERGGEAKPGALSYLCQPEQRSARRRSWRNKGKNWNNARRKIGGQRG